MCKTIGWDIGGANVKAVLLDAEGSVLQALQLPCPLWKGLDYLAQGILNVLQTFGLQANIHEPSRASLNHIKHAITMTGELVDLFESRHEGVCQIAQLASKILGENCYFYMADKDAELDSKHCFVRLHDVHHLTSFIASANWHASATFLAKHRPDALLIDIGSTTSDIIPIINGAVALDGYSDLARLKNDTLVYTGVERTPIMALTQKLSFKDGDELIEINVMAELFATTADVYRLTGELASDDAETSDGLGKTQQMSARRLARMIGYDIDNNLDKWIQLAFACKRIQMQQIKKAVLKHLKPNMTIIGAGAGSFLVQSIASELNFPYQSVAQIMAKQDSKHQPEIEICLPAFSVAQLLLLRCAN